MSYEKELLHLDYSEQSVLKRYLNFYRNDKLNLFYTVILFVIKNSPAWLMPIITANIINTLEKPTADSMQYIIVQFCIGAVIVVQNVPSHMAFVWVFSSVSRRVEMELRLNLCTRLQHLSIPYHTNTKMGHMQTKVLRDVEAIEMLTRMLVTAIPSIIVSFAIAVYVTLERAPAFIFFYLITIPFVILICRFFRKRIQARNRNFRISVESMSGSIIEMLRLITVTRAHNVENDELQRVGAKLHEVKDSGLKLDKTNSIFESINWALFVFFNLVTVTVASILSYKKILVIGVGDIFLLGQFFGTLSHAVLQAINLIPMITKGFESVNSVSEILECPDLEMNEGRPAMHGLEGNIEFKSVSFSYMGSDVPAVEDFSFKVEKGDTIALVGSSGSGKSTIMQLLIGFIRPSSGELFIDGREVSDIDMRSYRRFISVVSQESVLFDGTIKDNITYGAKNVTDEDVARAIKSANLEEFIALLPDGVETRVKEGGARLSGGQKQRLSIARALLRDPQLLLLDEATSALDVESEISIQAALDNLIVGRTTFIVAHRLSTIRNANKIIVMSHGKIVESGSHRELMEKHGTYYQMVKLQTPGELVESSADTIHTGEVTKSEDTSK